MKSPWKFLVGLMRRHDKHDAPDVISATSEEASSDSDMIAQTAELEAVPPCEEAEKGPRRRANKRRTEINSTPVQLATPRDHAQELDNEIRRLRLQLEQKLRVQNAQLRQMLARFEV